MFILNWVHTCGDRSCYPLAGNLRKTIFDLYCICKFVLGRTLQRFAFDRSMTATVPKWIFPEGQQFRPGTRIPLRISLNHSFFFLCLGYFNQIFYNQILCFFFQAKLMNLFLSFPFIIEMNEPETSLCFLPRLTSVRKWKIFEERNLFFSLLISFLATIFVPKEKNGNN